MVGTNPGGDLDALVEAGNAAVHAAQRIAQRRGDRMVFAGWAGADGTGGFGGPDSPRRIADDEETTTHLVRLGTCLASHQASRFSDRSSPAIKDELTTATASDDVEVKRLLNELHAANLVYQPERGRYRLTSNGEHAVGMLFWAALQVRRPLPAQFNQWGWFDA